MRGATPSLLSCHHNKLIESKTTENNTKRPLESKWNSRGRLTRCHLFNVHTSLHTPQ